MPAMAETNSRCCCVGTNGGRVFFFGAVANASNTNLATHSVAVANLAKLPDMLRIGSAGFFNASFTEAVQRESASVIRLDGENMKSIAMISRARLNEAIALAVFAGMVVLFVHKIVPLIAD
jgi:hypothetical protein